MDDTQPTPYKPPASNPKTRADDARGTPAGAGSVTPAHGGRIGNPPHVVTYENQIRVEALAKVMAHDMIAQQLGISKATLTRHYREQLDSGLNSAVETVGNMLLKQALDGHFGSQVFYLRTRGKGAYSTRVEHTGADGNAIQTADLSRLTPEQLEEYGRLAFAAAGMNPDDIDHDADSGSAGLDATG